MRKKIICLVIGLTILLPGHVNGAMCTNEDKLKFQELARNITANYEYVEENGDVTFTIKFNNIPEGFIIYNFTDDKKYENPGSELVVPAEKNKSYKFNIFTSDIACHLSPLHNIYITVPGYNKYYNDDLCEGIEDYKLCYKWLNMTMEYDDWKKEVNKYIEKLNKKEEKKEKEIEKGIFETIFDFINTYYLILIPGIIILFVLIRIIYNKKHDLF